MASVEKKINIIGMHCANCERRVREALGTISGVTVVSVDWKKGSASVTFDDEKTGLEKIGGALEKIGYHVKSGGQDRSDEPGGRKTARTAGVVFAAIGLGIIVYLVLSFSGTLSIPDITPTMGFGLLFVVGLLTGFHCVGMCGGFVVGYSTKAAMRQQHPALSHLQYGAGKLMSYTVMGAAFGLLGSFITFTPRMRGIAGVLAGAFLLIYGLSMLGTFSWARRLRIRPPAFLDRFVQRESSRSKSPLVIGLLNGLMIACGPLQAIYVMAAGTGSAVEGAKSLFAFGAGTLPVMLGFGLVTGAISARATKRILVTSGVIVMVLGLIMVNRGMVLWGKGLDASSLIASGTASEIKDVPNGVEMENGYQIIRMKVTRYGWEPNRFVLVAGVPVKWIITGIEINSCNNAIVVPEYGLNFPVRNGEQVIEFTPKEKGVVSWSCWMGMIPGKFVVKEPGDFGTGGTDYSEPDSIPLSRGSTCRMGGSAGGGCCGGSID